MSQTPLSKFLQEKITQINLDRLHWNQNHPDEKPRPLATDAELAEASHVPIATFSRWRLGQGMPTDFDRVAALAQVLSDYGGEEIFRVVGMQERVPSDLAWLITNAGKPEIKRILDEAIREARELKGNGPTPALT